MFPLSLNFTIEYRTLVCTCVARSASQISLLSRLLRFELLAELLAATDLFVYAFLLLYFEGESSRGEEEGRRGGGEAGRGGKDVWGGRKIVGATVAVQLRAALDHYSSFH